MDLEARKKHHRRKRKGSEGGARGRVRATTVLEDAKGWWRICRRNIYDGSGAGGGVIAAAMVLDELLQWY